MEVGPFVESEVDLTRLGVMQGRLSDPVGGKIQSFPWDGWEREFAAVEHCGLSLMEWTLDDLHFMLNPLLDPSRRWRIVELKSKHGVRIHSVTCDFIMEHPPHKELQFSSQLSRMNQLISSCDNLGIRTVVLPFVDRSSITSGRERDQTLRFLTSLMDDLDGTSVRVALEMDLTPTQMGNFLAELPGELFGVNYDAGNSASLGFPVDEEMESFGQRILNVHLKDRPRGGTTVRFGEGDVDFISLFRLLRDLGYDGNFILQGARSPDMRHSQQILEYVAFCIGKGFGE